MLQLLTEEEMRQVLTEPENAIVKQKHKHFAQDRCLFHVSSAALKKVASQARTNGTGARGLRTILENAVHDASFEVWCWTLCTPLETLCQGMHRSVNPAHCNMSFSVYMVQQCLWSFT